MKNYNNLKNLKIVIDGRPIREPVSGVATYVLSLYSFLKKNVNIFVFIQSNIGKNKHISLIDYKNSILDKSPKFISNILYELKLIFPSKILFHIRHETYFARLPFRSKYLISTIHDVIPLEHPEWFTFRNYFFSKRNFFRQMKLSDHVIFPSKFTQKKAFELFGNRVDSSIIPIPYSKRISKYRKSYNKDTAIKKNFILVVGNVEERKNITFTAKAIELYNKKYNDNISLLIAGKAIYKSNRVIDDLKKINLNYKLLGFIPESLKIKLYQTCLLHIISSKYEGFGIPVIESQVIGAPTLCFNGSSLREVVIDKALLFDNLDEAVIKIRQFKNKPIFNIYKNKYDDFCYKYNEENFINSYLKIYKKLI